MRPPPEPPRELRDRLWAAFASAKVGAPCPGCGHVEHAPGWCLWTLTGEPSGTVENPCSCGEECADAAL